MLRAYGVVQRRRIHLFGTGSSDCLAFSRRRYEELKLLPLDLAASSMLKRETSTSWSKLYDRVTIARYTLH